MYFPLPSMHCKRSWQPQLLGSHTCPTPSKHYLWNDGVIRPPHTASREATRGLITVKTPALSLHVEPAASPHKNRGQHWSQPHTWSYYAQCVEPLNPTIATHNQCMCQWDPTTFIIYTCTMTVEMPALTHTASPVSSLAQPVVLDGVIQTPHCQQKSYQLPHNQGSMQSS